MVCSATSLLLVRISSSLRMSSSWLMLPSGLSPRGRNTGDGIKLYLAGGGIKLQVRLRGGTEEFVVRAAHVEHVRRGVGLAELTVGGECIGAIERKCARGTTW